MYNIQTFGREENPELFKKFVDFKAGITDTHYRISNYTDEWNYDEHLAISLFLNENGEVYGFSSIYQREFFPKGHARILNRYYVTPEYREGARGRDHTIHVRALQCSLSQIEWLLHSSNLDVIFVSYEGYKPNWIRLWTDSINKMVPMDFITDDKFYCVCPHPSSKKCWHHISYAEMTKDIELDSIDYTAWKNLDN